MTSKARGLAQLGNAYSDGALGSRNRIINGAMTIDQRNAGAAVSVVSADPYTVDRFFGTGNSPGVFSAQQVSDAPAGFTKSLRATTTTIDDLSASDKRYLVRHILEGNNTADLGWGTAAAQAVTISFWVKSSLTGTFGGVAQTTSGSRSYVFSYVISASGTWEYKTITIPGDTSGTWPTDNSGSIMLGFSLGASANLRDTAGAWYGGNRQGATGQVNVISTNGATWQITGVQLEAGDTATPFEHRSYGQELALCERYCVNFSGVSSFEQIANGVANSTTSVQCLLQLPTEMRATPSISVSPSANLQISDANSGSTIFVLSVATSQSGKRRVTVNATSSGLTIFRPYRIETNGVASFLATAEL